MEQYAKRHTPGPWKIEQELIDDPRLDIADITAPVPGTQYKTEVARVYCENRKGATVGPNARLIAAAPTMYAALKGPHGDRLNFLQSILNTAANELDAETGADGDQDAWAMAIAESIAFIVEARAAIKQAEGGAK